MPNIEAETVARIMVKSYFRGLESEEKKSILIKVDSS